MTHLTAMFRHNLWANLRLVDACAALNEGQLAVAVPGTYGAARDTLVHLAGAESRYVLAMRGVSADELTPDSTPVSEARGFPGIGPLRAALEASGAAFIELARATAEGAVLRGQRGGHAYEMPASAVLVQAINHATEHRAQVTAAMTQAGVEPPVLDAWTWAQAGAP
ncbi:MAG: DinB family protein [Chloroflexota bacterium]|nr:DinB family protein [Chloroflexota bacterium]